MGSALPLSALMVLAGMRLLGVPIHQMSVTGLIIALGLLIDNAIVMVDEANHRMEKDADVGRAVATVPDESARIKAAMGGRAPRDRDLVAVVGKVVAQEGAAQGITVNAIAPGYVDTDMVRAVPQKVLERIIQRIPMGRLGNADDIARGVLFLVADNADFVTGSTLSINGGQHMY